MNEKLRQDVQALRGALLQAHEDVSRVWHRDGTDEFHESIMVLVVLSRSKSLTRGFFDLLLSLNLTTAAALMRLQLDNLLRLVALFIAADRCQFFHALMEGENITRFKDAGGERMTDKYLCERVAEFAPWVTSLYKQGSGFIHFSHKHLRAMVQGHAHKSRIDVWFDDDEGHLPDDSYDSIAGAFGLVTRMLLDFICESCDPEEATLSYPQRRDIALKRMAQGIAETILKHGIPATAAEAEYVSKAER